jgi:hypothetical protein
MYHYNSSNSDRKEVNDMTGVLIEQRIGTDSKFEKVGEWPLKDLLKQNEGHLLEFGGNPDTTQMSLGFLQEHEVAVQIDRSVFMKMLQEWLNAENGQGPLHEFLYAYAYDGVMPNVKAR